MSESNPGGSQEWDSLEEWASSAVMGANNWMVTIRNAEDEGYDPWSDRFTASEVEQANETEQDTGLMSYSEGLTSLAMTDEFARERSDWLRLQPELYRSDLQEILDYINPGESDANYSPEPYIADEVTSDFTDAVSFSTSALMGALQSDIVLTDDEISEQDIISALEKNIEWFLDNEIKRDDGAIGWAWVGSEDSNHPSPTPQNYFTYAAIYPLAELLSETDNPAIQQAVDGYEDRIRRHLQGAKEFLLTEHWQQDRWGGPIGSDEVLSTCYSIISLSLLSALVEDIELDGGANEKISSGIEFLVDRATRNPENIWQLRARYNCGGMDYFDGSGPYLFLDTIAEFLNYDIGDVSEMDYSREDIESIRDELTREVLEKCWAGSPGFMQKGFRHLGNPERPASDPKNNPTVIYTTQVGIETFLLNILDEGEALIQPNDSTTEDTGSQRVEPPTDVTPAEETGAIQSQYNFNFVFANTDEDSIGTEGEPLHEAIRRELEGLFGNESGDTDGVPTEMLTTAKKFSQTAVTAYSNMVSQYNEIYGAFKNRLGRDVLKNAGAYADEDLKDELLEVNIDEFLRLLTECYFAQDAEAFKDELEYYKEQHWILVLKPQQDAWEDLNDMVIDSDSGYSWEESAQEFDQRASIIQGILEDFAADLLNGGEPQAIGNEFDQRDFSR